MHETSYRLMEEALRRAPWEDALCLDVGSLDINGSYRSLIEARGWRYLGLDITPGRNVDVVVDPFRYPFASDAFDAVISGCTLEHVAKPWLWIHELARILRPGGFLAIVTHWSFPQHRYPIDCWRLLPDGAEVLFDDTGLLEKYVIKVEETDILASAFRRPL